MKTFKKGAIALASIGLTIGLAGCGNEATKSSSSDDKDKPTVTDILNTDKKRQIIMTQDKGNTESPQVVWAGTIGDGKIEMHPYANKSDFEFDELNKLSMNDFKEKLKKEDKDYENYGDNEQLKIYPKPAKTILQTDNGDTTKKVSFKMKEEGLGNDKDIFRFDGPEYSEITQNNPDGWLGIKDSETSDVDPYVLYIKAEKGEDELSFEDAKKAKKEYDNVKVEKTYEE